MLDGCEVWWARTDARTDRWTGLLSGPEAEHWAALRHPADRARYAVAHAAARLVCASILAEEPARIRFLATCRHCAGPHGRLRVDQPAGRLRVSLSHSGNRAVVAVTRDVDVGVDVERISLRGSGPPLSALSRAEQDQLAELPVPLRPAAFVRYWTRKEAILKATGHGIVLPPARLTVSAPDAPPELLDWAGTDPGDRPQAVFLRDLFAGAGYRAALATLVRPLPLTEHDATPVLLAAG